MKYFEDKKYWINRHKKFEGSLRSIGMKSYNRLANEYKYRLVREQYKNALSNLDLPPKTRILDAGAGTGAFIPLFLNNERVSEIIATDVSDLALQQLKQNHPSVQTLTKSIIELGLPNHSVDLVHCFDVLYHIVDNEEWKLSIKNLCRISSKYVVVHGEINNNSLRMHSAHVKLRTQKSLESIFKTNGFGEKLFVSTHIFSHRFLLYKINGIFPHFFYRLDRFFTTNTPDFAAKITSHAIIVYERVK